MTEYPVTVQVVPATENRNRLTTAFRFFLFLPHLILVGGPAVAGFALQWHWHDGWGWGSSGGLIGAFVWLAVVVMWFYAIFTARHPETLYDFAAWYMRWRVRSTAYLMLLRDEYPPFGNGDGSYPAELQLGTPPVERNRLTILFRLLLVIPHLILLGVIGVFWAFTTAAAWVMILITGRYPDVLYGFALGALAWTTRVEAYVLLLRDEYPPFTLEV
jgi:hypothetical protein